MMTPVRAYSPPTSHASITNDGSPSSASAKPEVVKTPAPIVLAITKAVGLRKSKRRGLRHLSSWQGPLDRLSLSVTPPE